MPTTTDCRHLDILPDGEGYSCTACGAYAASVEALCKDVEED